MGSVVLDSGSSGVTCSLCDSRNSLFPRNDAHIISILNQLIILTTREVRKRLSIVDERDIQQSLSKCRSVSDDIGRVDTLEDVIREKSSNSNGVVLVLDSLSFWNISRNSRESVVGGGNDCDIGGCGQFLCETVYEADKLEQGAEIGLGLEEGYDVTLGKARACHQDGRPNC